METQSRFEEEVFERLKRIIKGAQFSYKLNSKPDLVRQLNMNGPPTTQALTIDAIKIHEVTERSLKTILVQGVREPDKRGVVGVPLWFQLLRVVYESDGRQMFINIEKMAEGAGCTVAFSKKYGGEAREWFKNIGFRFTEMFGVTMLDLFTSKERERISATVRTDGFVVSPEDKELTAASAELPWFDMTLLYRDKAADGTPEFTIEEIKTIQIQKLSGKSTSSVEYIETVGNGTRRGRNMGVSTVDDGDTVGLGGTRSGGEANLGVDELTGLETIETMMGGGGEEKSILH